MNLIILIKLLLVHTVLHKYDLTIFVRKLKIFPTKCEKKCF